MKSANEKSAKVKKEKEKNQSGMGVMMTQLKRNKLAIFGLIVIVVAVILGFLAPWITPYNYAEVDPINANLTPCFAHPFGTDSLGRDMLTRCIYGARYSLGLGFISELSGVVIGVIIGAFAGYVGGRIDNYTMRFCDILQSIPATLLAICISSALGSGFFQTIIALAVSGIPVNARLMRAQILSIREQEYIEGAKAITVPEWKIVIKYMIPNGWAPIIVGSTMGIGGKILSAAGLSYLGLGIQPPTPEWGAMLSAGKDYLRYYPHLVIFPGICIMIVTLAFNLFGEGLRDASDPKLRQ